MVRWVYLTGKKDSTAGLIDEQLKEYASKHTLNEYELYNLKIIGSYEKK